MNVVSGVLICWTSWYKNSVVTAVRRLEKNSSSPPKSAPRDVSVVAGARFSRDHAPRCPSTHHPTVPVPTLEVSVSLHIAGEIEAAREAWIRRHSGANRPTERPHPRVGHTSLRRRRYRADKKRGDGESQQSWLHLASTADELRCTICHPRERKAYANLLRATGWGCLADSLQKFVP
jgi:hypothetical protein